MASGTDSQARIVRRFPRAASAVLAALLFGSLARNQQLLFAAGPAVPAAESAARPSVVHPLANAKLAVPSPAKHSPAKPASLVARIGTAPLHITAKQIRLVGKWKAIGGGRVAFDGRVFVDAMNVRGKLTGKQLVACNGLGVVAAIQATVFHKRLVGLTVSSANIHGTGLRIAGLHMRAWRAKLTVANGLAKVLNFRAGYLGGQLLGGGQYASATKNWNCAIRVVRINAHKLLKNFDPSRVDAHGTTDGLIHIADKNGHLSGSVLLKARRPGILRIAHIPFVRKFLQQHFGAGMATEIVRQLRRYHYKAGTVRLKSQGNNTRLTLDFDPEPGVAAPKAHMIVLGGRKVLVRPSLKKIDATVTLKGTSLSSIMKTLSGLTRKGG